jgi:Subtilase family
MRLTLVTSVASTVIACAGLVGPAQATPYTPLQWQARVDVHSDPAFIGQRKHLSWVRDRNRNFVDDEIERRFKPGDKLDVVLALNDCATPATLEGLSAYGKVAHVGQLVSAVYLQGVRFDDLRALARRAEVAMVEWQAPMVPEIDIAARATQARDSMAFPATPTSAQTLGLTGAGVNIAFIGMGIDDGNAGANNWLALPTRAVAGVDFTDATDPRDGSRNPQDAGWRTFPSGAVLPGHETTMAMFALGREVAAAVGDCRQTGANCRGLAPAAGIVDLRTCTRSGPNNAPVVACDSTLRAEALDWIGANARRLNIRVALLAYSVCGTDDGTSVEAQQVNHLAALGVVPVASVASVGNENAFCRMPADPQATAGTVLVKRPSSAAYALSVTGTNDQGTATRSDDTIWANHLDGPRSDFNLMTPNLLALKPDFSSPATGLNTAVSNGINGTSGAAAIVAGLAALLIERVPTLTPEAVKELLRSSADSSRNSAPFDASTAVWQKDLGWGLVNVSGALALSNSRRTNVKFPSCDSPSTSGNGNPCSLAGGAPFWLNTTDITSANPPQPGVANTVRVMVQNTGSFPARVRVHFGNYPFGTGATQFHDLGTREVDVPPGQSVPVEVPWTPSARDHECIQVSLAYGEDIDFSDNLTQRNFEVKPSLFDVRVENSFGVPARFEVVATTQRKGWACVADQPGFDLDPHGCARKVQVAFEAPAGTKEGDSARCDVAVYATPKGGERTLVGGVSLGTYVPRQCRVSGVIVDEKGRPQRGARVAYQRVTMGGAAQMGKGAGDGEAPRGPRRTASTGSDGTFALTLMPDVVQRLSVNAGAGKGSLLLRPDCGGQGRVVVRREKIELLGIVPRLVRSAPPAGDSSGKPTTLSSAAPQCTAEAGS